MVRMSKRNDSKRDEALADLHRLSRTVLENLEQGSRDKLMDAKEMRLLAATVLRSIRLYLRTLDADQPKHRWIRRAPHERTSVVHEEQVKADEE